MSLSQKLFERAKKIFPGGVNSPARALKPYPPFIKEAEGSKIYTVDGQKYIDYCMAFGPLILGHKNLEVMEAVREQLEKGWLYGLPYELEMKLAEKIIHLFPTVEMLRFVNSGTEATMNAIRVARGYTGRSKIIKFEGNYHGSHDYMLVKAGSSALTFGIPTSDGIPEDTIKNTLIAKYNDINSVEKLVKMYKRDIAAIIVEPVAVNMGLVLPDIEFLKGLREICDSYGSLLIFDEVVTAFRLDLGGAQRFYNIKADITTFGKIIGGGFPIGAYGGPREIMKIVTPSGKVHNAGTFNAHPVSIAAGLKTIEIIEREGIIEKASNVAKAIADHIKRELKDREIKARVYQLASMFQIFFTDEEVRSFEDVNKSDKKLFIKFHKLLMSKGIYWAPSQFETCFASSAHTKNDIKLTISALSEVFEYLENQNSH